MDQAYIGMIIPMAFNFAPRNWASCEGQLLSISANTALFSLLGTTYGGDGRSTFGLPDLRGRRVIGQGVSPTLGTYQIGQKGGVENTTVLMSQMPAHNHNVVIRANQLSSESNDPQNTFLGGGVTNLYTASTPDVAMATNEMTIAITGGSQPINIQSPYLAMYYNICQYGIFPSRN